MKEKRETMKQGNQGFMGHGPGAGMMAKVEKAKDFRKTFKRLLNYFSPNRSQIIIVFLFAIASSIFSILSPKVMGNITTALYLGFSKKIQDISGTSIDFAYIGRIILILIGLYLLSSLFSYIQQYIMSDVAQKTVYQMRKDVKEKLTRLPLSYYDSKPHGEILSRVTNDIDNISSTLQQSLVQFITSIVTVIGVIIMMLTISPILTVITMLILPLSGLAVKNIASASQKYFGKQWKKMGELNGHIEEMYTGHKIVKAFGHEDKAIAQFSKINDDLYQYSWKAQFISGVIMPVMNFIGNIGYVLVCVFGGIFAARGSIAIGDIQAFILYSRNFTQPITQIASIANTIQSTIASAERVFEILDEEEEIPDSNHVKTIESPQGYVTMENVRFSYEEGIPIIKNMNIDVKKGDVIAIVGPTGAGKTTLVNLLMRFYEIDSGEISVDGIPITDLKRGELRNIFGMVLQDTWLFKGTIRDNIVYSKEDATEEEIIKAAKLARADHFIRTLPDGYDTVLNEEASNISQGQKQLLTIARALLADPTILILDEATSSVDTRTEQAIQKAMVELMKDRTNFVIAHRLSTIKNADLILVINQGDIIEQGNHDELLAKKGFYADLYTSQFSEAI